MEIVVQKKYLSNYANFFNRSYLLDFINKKEPKKILDVISLSLENKKNDFFIKNNIKNYSELFTVVYEIIKNDYKCEYIYLNEIFINEILKNHETNHKIITEFYVNNSRADLVIINGTTTVYEIKTELDTLNRLEKQLEDYVKVFDKIYVVTNKNLVNPVKNILKNNISIKNVGIYILENDGNLKKAKQSYSHIKKLDKESIYNCLLKKESEKIDSNYILAKQKFLKYSNARAHNLFKEFLISREKKYEFIKLLPPSLKMAGFKIQNTLTKKQKEKFYEKLNNKIK